MTRVRVEVAALDAPAVGWRISYLGVDGAELAPARELRAVGEPPFTFPLPPSAEVGTVGADAVHRELVAAVDEEPMIDALAELVARGQGSYVVERIGRYLHSVLFGAAWPQVQKDRMQIALSLPKNDAALCRFPWETMHDGASFLTLRPGTTLVRRVESTATLAPASTPLDVLFVVGGGLRDDVIRPAAEYLALVQSLRSRGVDRRLRPRLLLDASTDKIAAAIELDRPAVVHFMTHGRIEAGRPHLEIRSQDGGGVEKLYPEALVELLRDDDEPLPIIVLSACHTGSAKETARRGEAAAPFAVTLVEHGAPLAVGMTGPVGDLACRFFTREFYGALLKGQDAAAAAAAGRRAAVVHSTYDPTSAYDWALPTLFLSSSLESPRLEIVDSPIAARRQKLARELEPGSRPVFCDRLPVLAAGEALLAADSVQKRLMPGPERQVLTISSKLEAAAAGGEQFGRTWVLHMIAGRAALAGHVPVLVSQKYLRPNSDPPGDWKSFLRLLVLAMRKTASELGVAHSPCAASRFLVMGGERPADLPADLEFAEPGGDGVEIEPDDMAIALGHDLEQLLAAVRAELPEERREACRLLLLIDDLHRMGELTSNLLGSVLGPAGLRLARSDMRVVFTWVEKAQSYQASIRRIVDWFEGRNVERLELERFQHMEERLAYQHLLFHHKKPLSIARGLAEEEVSKFYGILSRKWKGVPSNLRTAGEIIDDILAYQETGFAMEILVPAVDEDVVEKWLAEEGQP